MKKIFLYFDKFSFRQLTFFALILGMLVMLPVGVWLSQQPTRTGSKAALEPTVIPTQVVYGQPPTEEPIIRGVVPYVGKVGDEIVVWGENFGHNPSGAKLFIGGVLAKNVSAWEDKEIRLTIPDGVKSGTVVLRVGQWQVEFDRPITVYDKATATKVAFPQGKVIISNAGNIYQFKLWPFEGVEPKLLYKEEDISGVWELDLGGLKPIWVVLFDKEGQIVPFWIDPVELEKSGA